MAVPAGWRLTWLGGYLLILGRGVVSSQGSDELLSVPEYLPAHRIRHARKALRETPVTDAPHLF